MDYNDYQAGATGEHFWFKAKKQLIFNVLNTVKNNSRNKSAQNNILNIGAGTGDDLAIIKQFGNIYAIDVNQKALDLIPPDLVFEKKIDNACSLSYEDNFFDRIVAFDVLEHIENDNQAVKEILRTLKPGGFFIFTVPAFNFLYSEHDRHLEHYRRYNKPMLRKLFTDFKQIRLGYWNFLLFPGAAAQRLINKNKIYNTALQANPASKINTLLYNILNFETWLVTHRVPLPYGLSLFGIYQKQK